MNVQSRGLSFALVEQLDWGSALIAEDSRKDYGEQRFQAMGFIGDRLHAVVFTPRGGMVHVISLRKANLREVNKHAEASKS